MSCYCAGVEWRFSWLSSSKTLPFFFFFLEATLQCVSISFSLSLWHMRTHKCGRTKHWHQRIHIQHYSPCWVLPLGREENQEESDEDERRGEEKKFDVSPDNNNSPQSAKVGLNYDDFCLIKIQTHYCARLQSPLSSPSFTLPLSSTRQSSLSSPAAFNAHHLFPSFFTSYVRTETHTAADMHKLLHRCLTRQYEHSDLFIFPPFGFSPIPSIFLSSSRFIHEKVSLGSAPEKLHKDKIFYRGWKEVHRKRAFLLHLQKRHEYIWPY